MNDPDEAIHATLSGLLLGGQLPPGTQLVETRVAALFDVSRERVRKALHRLVHERLLERIPNRGVFVREPSLEQAREIYETRRITEGGLAGWLARRGLTRSQADAVRRHLAQERAAAAGEDRSESVRLSAEFHLLLAQAADSPEVVSHLRDMVSRTSMLVALFEHAGSAHCACEEHERIFSRILEQDVAGALDAMHTHLSMIETRLRPLAGTPPVDVEAVLRRAWRDRQRGQRRARRGAAA